MNNLKASFTIAKAIDNRKHAQDEKGGFSAFKRILNVT